MGVYLSNIEMPRTHPITVEIYPNGTVLSKTVGSMDIHGKAVPVPPHGRLIDADALIESFDPSDFWNPDAEDNCFAAIHVVNCAPTIIEEER